MESILEARHQFRSEQPRLIKQLGVQCERVDLLIREGDPDAVHVAADAVRITAELAILLNASQARPISLPDLPVLYYYMGISDELGRLKYGITKDLEKRQAALRRNMVGLGFHPDFEMFEWIVGEAKEVRATEQQGLKLLKPHSRGGEWFDLNAEEVWEWQFTSARHLDTHLRQCLRDFDVNAHVQQALTPYARSPLFPTNIFERKSPEQSVVDQVTALWKHWESARRALMKKDWNKG